MRLTDYTNSQSFRPRVKHSGRISVVDRRCYYQVAPCAELLCTPFSCLRLSVYIYIRYLYILAKILSYPMLPFKTPQVFNTFMIYREQTPINISVPTLIIIIREWSRTLAMLKRN